MPLAAWIRAYPAALICPIATWSVPPTSGYPLSSTRHLGAPLRGKYGGGHAGGARANNDQIKGFAHSVLPRNAALFYRGRNPVTQARGVECR